MSFPVFLIGARGCGKTTIGRMLAQRLKYRFCDTDQYLQQTANCSIAQMVATHGWDYFRHQEHLSLSAVIGEQTIVATGGGIILREDNRQLMASRGFVVWLDAKPGVLVDRLLEDPEFSQRPTLTGRAITDEVVEVMQQRLSLYQATAHCRIDAERAPDWIVDTIVQHIALNDSFTLQPATAI